MPEEKDAKEQQEQQQIIQSGSVTTETNGKHIIHCLTVIGQIEGHYILPAQNKTTKYEHVIPQLVATEQDPEIEGLIVILNTVGGDVEAGLAIAELISTMETPVVSLVLGGGHSIGVPLACSAKYSFIAPSATMTVHPVRMNGMVIGTAQTYEYFEMIQDRILTFVSGHADIAYDQLKGLMHNTRMLARDLGTVLVGKEAVDAGLINEVGGIKEALGRLYQMIEGKGSRDGKK